MLSLFSEKELKKTEEYFKNAKDVVFFTLNDENDALKSEKTFFVHEKYDFVFHLDDFSQKSEELICFWTGHNHFRYKKTFDEIFKEIKFTLETSFEIEKKFLIEYPDISYLNSLKNAKAVEIEQAYLKENKEKIRIRKRGINGNFTYYKTMKKNVDGFKKEETETLLSKEEYDEKMSTNPPLSISKTRYCLSENHTYYEIDVYPFWKDKATLEIELKSEDEPYVLPKNIKVIKDVSDDKSYSNRSLSKTYSNNRKEK